MKVEAIINSVFSSVTYILSELGFEGNWLVDCGDVERLDEGVPVTGVLLTHAHFDHIYGLNKLLKRCPNVMILTNAYGKEALLNPKRNLSRYHPDIPDFVIDKPENVTVVEEGTSLNILGHPVIIKSVPGHNDSCLAFIVDGKLFTGDAYIPGEKVVTNLPGCNKELAEQSLHKLVCISFQYELFPGHPGIPISC